MHRDSASLSSRVALFSTAGTFFSLFTFRFTDTHHTLCTHTGIASRAAAAASHAGSPLQAMFFFSFFLTQSLLTVLQHRHRLDEPTDHSAVGAATRQSTAPPRASTRQGGPRLTPRQLTHRQQTRDEREHDSNERDDDEEHDDDELDDDEHDDEEHDDDEHDDDEHGDDEHDDDEHDNDRGAAAVRATASD